MGKLWREPIYNFDFNEYAKINEKYIELIAHLDWYDGPLNGILRYNGSDFWFDYIFLDNDDDGRHYFYAMFPLTENQIKECYEKISIGIHNRNIIDYQWIGPDLCNAKPIGWFTDGCNNDFYGIKVEYNE